jgi:short-subunit dehydrogenase
VIDVNKGLKLGIMMTAHNVAKKGIEGMFARKSVVIPGTLTKIMTYASVLTPQWMIYLLRKQWRKLFGNE